MSMTPVELNQEVRTLEAVPSICRLSCRPATAAWRLRREPSARAQAEGSAERCAPPSATRCGPALLDETLTVA